MAAIRRQTRREKSGVGQALKSINCTCLDLPNPHPQNHPETHPHPHHHMRKMVYGGWAAFNAFPRHKIVTDRGPRIEQTTLSVI